MAKRKPTTALPAMDPSVSMRIEKIHNGYLAHHSTNGPKGYQTKTVFHPTKPALPMLPVPPTPQLMPMNMKPMPKGKK